jgi:hypothetical protein
MKKGWKVTSKNMSQLPTQTAGMAKGNKQGESGGAPSVSSAGSAVAQAPQHLHVHQSKLPPFGANYCDAPSAFLWALPSDTRHHAFCVVVLACRSPWQPPPKRFGFELTHSAAFPTRLQGASHGQKGPQLPWPKALLTGTHPFCSKTITFLPSPSAHPTFLRANRRGIAGLVGIAEVPKFFLGAP